MASKYKVFIENIPIYFFDAIKEKKWYIIEDKETAFVVDPLRWDNIISDIENGRFKKKALVISSVDIKKHWQMFLSYFNIIKAAGGIVELQNEKTLWIFRNGKWDIPKGKREKKENYRYAAKREIIEETGIREIELQEKIIDTYHTYKLKGKRNLKKTRWYRATSKEEYELIPQIKEGITKVKWVKPNKTEKCLSNTYSSINDVYRAYLKSKKLLI